MNRPTRSSLVFAVAAMAAVAGCKDEGADPGELLVTAMIGPAGGELSGSGLTLKVPPGALTAETLVELRAAGDNLSASSYRQSGQAFELFPQGLPLALPAELSFTSGPDKPAILFRQDGMTVAGDGLTTYINEFNKLALAEAGVRLTNFEEPSFAPSPEAATTVLHDSVAFSMQITDTPQVNVVFTLYDFDDVHMQDLNGVSVEGDCGFELENVTGASLSAGCTEGPLTAQLRGTSPNVHFTAVPFQAGKVSPSVPVGVIAGGTELAYFMGFFSFDTSPCYQETCDRRGVCEIDTTGAGACTCDPGYATPADDPFACECVPVCTGRECGPDSCGGSCGDCGDGRICRDDVGLCEDVPPDPTTGGAETGMTDSGGTTGDPTGTGTMSDPTMGTTMG